MNQVANTVRKAIYTHLTTILKDSKFAIVTSRRSKDQLERGEGGGKERKKGGGRKGKKKQVWSLCSKPASDLVQNSLGSPV